MKALENLSTNQKTIYMYPEEKMREALREGVFSSPRSTNVTSARTVDVLPLGDTTGLHIVQICGRSVRFEQNGQFYFATNRLANRILQNPRVPVFVEVREIDILQPSGKQATITQLWLATPSRF